MRRVATLALLLTFAACEGPMGPEGPAGPPGIAGEAGPGTRVVYSGQFTSSSRDIELPSEAGDRDEPPLVTAYMSPGANDGLLLMDQWTSSDPYWVLRQNGSVLRVEMRNQYVGWYYRVVVIY